ncbi:hypothetical protein DH2020_000667 [Rehmannia glutinosa]|uniref:Uncharacterized protein n=1 Tax=Rehmannia glutinosa TaxID=99300 RepID=A0ABR0XX92_REHGL
MQAMGLETNKKKDHPEEKLNKKPAATDVVGRPPRALPTTKDPDRDDCGERQEYLGENQNRETPPPIGESQAVQPSQANLRATTLMRRSPFALVILCELLPSGIKTSNLSEYDGTGDPQEHLDKFYAKADIYDMTDASYCKVFHTTVTKRALMWFNQLLVRLISGMDKLTEASSSPSTKMLHGSRQ